MLISHKVKNYNGNSQLLTAISLYCSCKFLCQQMNQKNYNPNHNNSSISFVDCREHLLLRTIILYNRQTETMHTQVYISLKNNKEKKSSIRQSRKHKAWYKQTQTHQATPLALSFLTFLSIEIFERVSLCCFISAAYTLFCHCCFLHIYFQFFPSSVLMLIGMAMHI